jgi:hypothetical protein
VHFCRPFQCIVSWIVGEVIAALWILWSPYVFLLSVFFWCNAFVVLCICCTVNFDDSPDAGLLARGQYSEGPATGNLDTGFSWFPRVFKQMLRWFPTFQVAT